MRGHFAFSFSRHLIFGSFIGLCVCSLNTFYRNKVNTFEFLMPHVIPNAIDNHLCMKILIRDNFYLVGFEPKASTDVVHQMILYGCTAPGSNDSVWNCDEPPGSAGADYYDKAAPCRDGSQVMYGWGRNASGFQLPRHVGFPVGPASTARHLVLQVHYLRRYRADRSLIEIDNSGVILRYTKKRMARVAGVILLGSGGVIPARSVEHLETTCTIRENKTIHPIAFRAHTHMFGAVVSCFAVRQGASGDSWTTLAKSNPARAQAFYPVRDAAPLRRGDMLAARCTVNNSSPHTVRVGKTERDEICNLYLMYWAADGPLEQKYCMSPGPPHYYWRRAIQHFQNIPDLQASIL